MKPTLILDAGHGIDTQGKCSPTWRDGKRLMEYEFNRDIVVRIASMLDDLKIRYVLLVSEDSDLPLPERCARANAIWENTCHNAYLLSIHANEGSSTGWECITMLGEAKSETIADILYAKAQKAFLGNRIRHCFLDGEPDEDDQFYILRNTLCPSVLTQNFYMNVEGDCRYIMSAEGRDTIARMHLEGIKSIYDLLKIKN